MRPKNITFDEYLTKLAYAPIEERLPVGSSEHRRFILSLSERVKPKNLYDVPGKKMSVVKMSADAWGRIIQAVRCQLSQGAMPENAK